MRLKAWIAVLFIAAILLLLSWPISVGAPPVAGAEKAVVARYLVRLVSVFTIACGLLLTVAGLALKLARQTREDLKRDILANVRELVEGGPDRDERAPDASRD